MRTEKTIGILLILGAVGVLVPYTILTIIFDYPHILRQETGVILTKFHQGGNQLIWTWWAFAILGLLLLEAVVLLGQKLEQRFYFMRWATTLGIIGLIVQIFGLMRWTFVVPVLADNYISGDEMTKTASMVAFQAVHQYGGVILGEHIGQLFTIAWTIMISSAFMQIKVLPKWVNWLGFLAAGIYLLAQLELFETVMPNIFVFHYAGLIGSSLWIIWLFIVGLKFRLKKVSEAG